MANTTPNSQLELEKWKREYFKEYVRENQFNFGMGMTPNSMIHVLNQNGVGEGQAVTIPLVTRLKNDAVVGDDQLEGNEEALGNYGHRIIVELLANAVRVGKAQRIKSAIDLLAAGREMLKVWSGDKLRLDIIEAMLSPVIGGAAAGNGLVKYADATEIQKDAWLAANFDRIIFGSLLSNNAANDHSASLANIDDSSDKLTPELVSLAKRRAKKADARIRPFRVQGDAGEMWCLFAHSFAFRDLKTSTTMQNAMRDALPRARSNPIFTDGDLYWDGVVIKEIEELEALSGVGAAGIDVAPNFLCGAQALGLSWGQKPEPIFDDFDYKRKKGVGIEEIRGVEKLFFNDKQHGMVTLYTAGVADS